MEGNAREGASVKPGDYLTGSAYPRLMGDGKLASYVSALNAYYPTGVVWGNSFLEQAREDYRGWFFTSPQNKGSNGQLKYPSISDIPDSDVPTKFILITHSMGNMAARLYIYSNELAAEGKYFDKGNALGSAFDIKKASPLFV
jgi:hypothetical protein